MHYNVISISACFCWGWQQNCYILLELEASKAEYLTKPPEHSLHLKTEIDMLLYQKKNLRSHLKQ